MKTAILAFIGMAGSMAANALGGWDAALQTLVVFMAMDFATGLMAAGIFKKSKGAENGALSSRKGFKGLARKCVQLFFVIIGHRLDTTLGTDFVRTAVIIAYTANETISIAENAGLMGMPLPIPIKKALDVLNEKGGGK